MSMLESAGDNFDDKVIVPALSGRLKELMGADLPSPKVGSHLNAESIDLGSYDRYVLAMSGGKDSIACLLHLVDLGVDMSRLELWHHDVDGREGSTLMDWPFMADYNRQLAAAFDVPIYFSWLQGGFEGEMLKENSFSQPHQIETPDGLLVLPRDVSRSTPRTRRKFPQVSANLQTRWCSSALKIDVGRRAINNQSRFNNGSTLFITGERREESANRAKYNQLEKHVCDRRTGRSARLVDTWRPVLNWSEDQVWDALERHGVSPPVPYRLGWSRSSCFKCIFNSPAIWSTIESYFPGQLDQIASYERDFGTTISRTGKGVKDLAASAKPLAISDLTALNQALVPDYTLPVLTDKWILPAGAYSQSHCGPT